MVSDGQRKGVADGVPVAEQVHGVATLSYAVRFEQRAPLLERAACFARHLANVGDVS